MWYEINVSKDGKHFFATHERSITCSKQLEEVFLKFEKSFLPEDGFKISVMSYSTVGTILPSYNVNTI